MIVKRNPQWINIAILTVGTILFSNVVAGIFIVERLYAGRRLSCGKTLIYHFVRPVKAIETPFHPRHPMNIQIRDDKRRAFRNQIISLIWTAQKSHKIMEHVY